MNNAYYYALNIYIYVYIYICETRLIRVGKKSLNLPMSCNSQSNTAQKSSFWPVVFFYEGK